MPPLPTFEELAPRVSIAQVGAFCDERTIIGLRAAVSAMQATELAQVVDQQQAELAERDGDTPPADDTPAPNRAARRATKKAAPK